MRPRRPEEPASWALPLLCAMNGEWTSSSCQSGLQSKEWPLGRGKSNKSQDRSACSQTTVSELTVSSPMTKWIQESALTWSKVWVNFRSYPVNFTKLRNSALGPSWAWCVWTSAHKSEPDTLWNETGGFMCWKMLPVKRDCQLLLKRKRVKTGCPGQEIIPSLQVHQATRVPGFLAATGSKIQGWPCGCSGKTQTGKEPHVCPMHCWHA